MIRKIILSLLFTTAIFTQIRLPKLISDGMVLQRDTELKIWGWASAGENVSINFNQTTFKTIADENGNWQIILPKQKAGGPYSMKIAGKNTIEINDILFGDVWLCSGQSNMETTMSRVSPLYSKEIPEINNPQIRTFIVPKEYEFSGPKDDISGGSWLKADQTNIMKFSAVGYFFAKEIQEKYNVPVGILLSAVGGSPAEAWVSEKGLKNFPVYLEDGRKHKNKSFIDSIRISDRNRINSWYSSLNEKDAGYANPAMRWNSNALNTSGWSVINIPGFWADTEPGLKNGVVWFRKTFNIPEESAGKSAKLNLGAIVDADSVFINEVFVGNTTYQYPPRRYEIPAGVLKSGENIITIRVVSNIGRGGFVKEKPYEIVFENTKIDLKGEWQYKSGAVMEPLLGETFFTYKPTGLFNAMIAPLKNYKIKGAIWYQGESNAERPLEYKNLLTDLIDDWRFTLNQGNIPFIVIQLPNFMEAKSEPSESNWARLREAQLKTLSVPNTALAVTIDIGEWNDIHPLNKKDVGIRCALAAQKSAYSEKDVIYSGPTLKSFEKKGDRFVLIFDNTGSGLTAKGEKKLNQFAVAGDDKKFVWAKAEIYGDRIIVWCNSVKDPVAVRYAWADNPEGANLYNMEGLPASPFRTDDW